MKNTNGKNKVSTTGPKVLAPAPRGRRAGALLTDKVWKGKIIKKKGEIKMKTNKHNKSTSKVSMQILTVALPYPALREGDN